MNPEHWQRIEALFQSAIEYEPEKRRAYLETACAGDASLREEVAALLTACEQADQFMERPAFQSQSFSANARTFEAPTLTGSRIGAYQVTGEIGRGGMGAVYLARRADDEYDKRVAIKVIKRGMDTDLILRRFKNERQILASLEHPFIARLLDGGSTEDGLPYLVMEYVEGTPIDRYCDERKLSTNERLKLFRQVCAAIHYAHQNLIIHRDIKPNNILVTSDGTPKLLDFGIAKLLSADADFGGAEVTETAMRLLTPTYASPEQVRGERVTTASDVYSLGVLLYELLTGHRPYRIKSGSTIEILRAVLEEQPEKPSTAISRVDAAGEGVETSRPTPESVSASREGEPHKLRRQLSGDVDTIVLMALRKEAQRRYASVEQFAEDIRRHLEGLPVLAHKDTFAYRARKFVKRNRVAVFATLLILSAVTIGVITTLTERARAERRFNEVRKLARAVIFDYHDAIADLQGATPVRERLVKDALTYLDSLAREASDDLSLKLELVGAYQKIGTVQGNSYYSNLGDTDGALESYRKASAILASLPSGSANDAAVRKSRARTHSLMGDVLWDLNSLPEALASYEEALGLYEARLASHTDDVEERRDLAKVYEKIGELYGQDGFANLGKTAEAISYYKKSLTLREALASAHPDDPNLRKDLYDSYLHFADVQSQTGDPSAAEQTYRNCLGMIEALSAAAPDNFSHRVEIASCTVRLALLLNQMERPAEAMSFLDRAVKIMESAAATDPTSAYYKRSLSVVYNHAVNSLLRLNRFDEALKYARQSLAISEALNRSEPTNIEYRSGVAIAHRKIGQALERKNDTAAALHHHRQTLAIHQQMTRETGDALSRDNLALSHIYIGELLAGSKDFPGALENFLQAQAIREALSTANPQNVVARHSLAETYTKVAQAQAQLAKAQGQQNRHWRDARAAYQLALQVYQSLREQGVLSQKDAHKPDEVNREIARCEAALAKTR